MNKYCHFHRDHGHDTEECHQLKEEIQELISQSFLRSFVAREADPRKDQERRTRSPPPRQDKANGQDHVRNSPRREIPPQMEEDRPQPPVFHTLTAREVPGTKTGEDLTETRTSRVKRSRKEETVSFSDNDLPRYPSRNDPLVITSKLRRWELRRILVDPGSSYTERPSWAWVSDGAVEISLCPFNGI
ncbi:uncharacterized protein LOC127811153 [Diospyros lotus]|uniref:uncharacterized protein LOC127811153 n=1 Tax=Diospyros lotus TaxID=55363 RepID=UPI002259E1C5|nr:uncharacterized protein LOC127811153 [Diospyros lotus]